MSGFDDDVTMPLRRHVIFATIIFRHASIDTIFLSPSFSPYYAMLAFFRHASFHSQLRAFGLLSGLHATLCCFSPVTLPAFRRSVLSFVIAMLATLFDTLSYADYRHAAFSLCRCCHADISHCLPLDCRLRCLLRRASRAMSTCHTFSLRLLLLRLYG